MKAVQLLEHGKPGRFGLTTLPDPQPGPGDVVVRVHACGLNRLDLWLEEDGLPIPLSLPRIPGCEIAGDIMRLGPEVAEWQIGDRVAVPSHLHCGQCEFCLRGEHCLCLAGELIGIQRDGGFAEQVLVPARVLVRLPEGVDYGTSAALTLAGSTAMHMLTDRVKVQSGDWVLVVGGASGVGSAAIQIAKHLGARVIATGSTPEKRELATRVGADFVIDSALDSWTKEVRKLTEKRGVDVVVEHVGGPVLEQVFHCLARGGSVVTCGATSGRHVSLNVWPLFVKQQRLIGSNGRNSADMQATLDWAAAGTLRPVIHRVYPLAEVPQAFAALRHRQALGKLIVETS